MQSMYTQLLSVNAATINRAASLLASGEVVAFPTETVYGLGADALSDAAIQKIFIAKGRPSDNPLIAHIADLDMLPLLAKSVDSRTQKIIDAFWPGPLTIILKKTDRVPDSLCAGLSTVAVRMPSHPTAVVLIRALGRPIAAPSANRSGRPSPTTAQHVLDDMSGRIPLIVDGGPCAVGVESTVVDMTADTPVILRPGGVTEEALMQYLPDIQVDEAVLHPLKKGAMVRSPGMKHRHYAPDADVIVVSGLQAAVIAKCCALYDDAIAQGKTPVILSLHHLMTLHGERSVQSLGMDAQDMAAHLYDALRTLDKAGYDFIIAQAVRADGMGLAVMNRLLRAADFMCVEA